MSKTVCIYHSIDLDGWMSAAIVKHWYVTNGNKLESISELELNNKIDKNSKELINTGKYYPSKEANNLWFLGYNYGQPIPDLSKYDRVIMVDISFPKDEMEKIAKSGIGISNFIWIDHHISAIKDISETDFAKTADGIRNTKFAACELTWKYFFPDETMPEIVRLLGRYDCFGHKGTDEETEVLEFQYAARTVISNYEQAYYYLQSYLQDDTAIIDSLPLDGSAIYKYLITEAKQAYKNGFELDFDAPTLGIEYINNNGVKNKYKFIAINKERFNPINFGVDYHKDDYDGAACFHYDGKVWKWSLYNDNGVVDCSIIAKQFGGGGHKGAAGFVLTNEEHFKLLNNK